MKTVSPTLATMLASGLTTLCRCWRIERLDGTLFGFTDHDRTLTFAGLDYEPQTGFSAAEAEQSLGLAIDTMEVESALSSDAITEADIALGRWDGAEVTIYVVDWSDTANRLIERKGSLGELTRGELAFIAEIRGLAHILNQEQGRTYGRICDAVLGDSRCGVDLTAPAFAGTGAVTAAIDGRVLTVSGLGSFASGWFSRGVLRWTSGASNGVRVEVRGHLKAAYGTVTLVLWEPAAADVAIGDTFAITAGCDKTFPTCIAKLANAANHRGFPHIPGNDFALGVAKKDQLNDGGSFFNG